MNDNAGQSPDEIADRIRSVMAENENENAMSPFEQLRAVAIEHLDECSFDELRVVVSIMSRLELGRARYGRLDLAADPRDWQRELGEELIDACIYAACVRLTKGAKP